MKTHRQVAARLRALFVAALFAFTTFGISIAPAARPITEPLGVAPRTAQAAYCASDPALTGRVTASSSSTTAVGRTKSSTVYGYISNVDAAWSCTLYYRYSGLTWNTSASAGTFDWGAIINSTSVACNWVVGSTDYLKANSTSDCPDFDAEYAMAITLSPQGVYQNDSAHNSTGDLSWVHSDCSTTTFYGGEVVATGQSFSTSITGNRPGANCDPIQLDALGTTQTVTYDSTAPTINVVTPDEAAALSNRNSTAYTVTFDATDGVSGFGGSNGWSLQRQIAPISSPGVCGTFASDAATGNLVTGTTNASGQTSAQTLVAGNCYRWILDAVDQNGNGSTAHTSGPVLVDTTAPTTDFGTPNEGTTTTQGATTYSVSWTETETQSGINTRSLQRQKVAVSGTSCGTSWANDGSPVTSASPVSAAGLLTATCYRWVQTLTDKAGNSTATTSGTVLVDTSNPTVDFSGPNEGTNAIQSATTYSVSWTETTGGASVTARSLQRQKAAVTTSGSCAGLTFATDGTAVTTASPVDVTGLVGGNCYRWVETITVSTGKQATSTSGTILVDTANPVAALAYPEANQPLAGSVTVTGTATDHDSFKNYVLDYGAGASPSSWTTIATVTSQVTSTATLATWSTSSLPAGVYTLRLTANDNAGQATPITTLVYVDNTRRGDESYWTSVPFDLGGGYSLRVGVANGEATLDRDLFTIPSYGPPQALSLHYSSQESTSTGRFGFGWISNLSQYLTFEDGFVVWHAADGGRVPFGLVGSTWTPLRGHFEVLGTGSGVYTVTLKDQTRLTFENGGAGRLTKIENRFGKALTLSWGTSSAMATDASGRATHLVLDGSGRITDATDSAGRHWGFRYNAAGDLDQITDPATNVTTVAYSSHALTSITRTRSRVSAADETITWSVGYTSGKATSVTDPINATAANTFTYNTSSTVAALLKTYSPVVRNSTTYTYDSLGRPTSILDPDGYTTSRTYDADSNTLTLVRPIDPGPPATNQTTTYTYDTRGNVLTETAQLDASTNVVTAYTYNATNDVLTRSEADNDSAVKLVTLNAYDGAGHLLSTDLNCTTTGTTPPATASTCTGAGTQDAATNLVTAYSYTANDQLLTETGPLGNVTKHVYDGDGNETSVIANCTSSGTTPPSPPSSCAAGGTHDAQTNVTTVKSYDPATTAGKAGLATSETDPVGMVATYTYDALGRRLTESLPGDSSIPAVTKTTAYDQLGNVLTETEAWTGTTNQTTHVYDLANRETSVTDPVNVKTTTSFDAAGNAISVTANGVTTTKNFDSHGNATDETTGGDVTTHAYDGQSREIETVDPAGETTDRTFDLAGRLLAETVQGAEALTTQHAYDKLGRELTTTDPQGTVTTNSYDRPGREKYTIVGSSRTDTAYDRNGNTTGVTGPYPSGGTPGPLTTTVYDTLNRVKQTIVNDVASPTLPTEDVTTTTYYDAAGHTIAVRDSRGVTTRSILNARGLVGQSIANCTDSGTTPTSNPPACVGGGTHDTATNVVTTNTYDGSGALTVSLVDHGDGTSATTTVATDGAGRQLGVKDPRGTVTRNVYDSSGRQTSQIVNCTDDTSNPQPPAGNWWTCAGSGLQDATWNLTTSYTYDAKGNKASETAPNGRVTIFAYDAAGKLTGETDNYTSGTPAADQNLTTYFGYDDADRQIGIAKPTADRSTFRIDRTIYDDAGRVIETITNCTNPNAVLPPDPGWEDCAGPAGGGTQDGSSNIVTTYTYDAQGNKLSETGPDPSATAGGAASVTTRFAYDDHNRLCRVVQNSTVDLQTLAHPCTDAVSGTTTQNVSTRYTYDDAGNLTSMVDADGHTTTYAYDAAAHMTSLVDALGGSTSTISWTYDSLGRKTGQSNRTNTVPLGPEVTWTYDGAGRVLSRTADGATTAYTYDASGNRLKASSSPGTITTTYDRLNRPLTVSVSSDSGAGTTYTYSLTSPTWTDPTGSYTATLDLFDREIALTDPIHGSSTFTTTYRADGQRASTSAPNGNTTTYGYDGAGRESSRSTVAGATSRAAYTWLPNAAGHVTSETSQISGDPTNGTTTDAYDPLGRLTAWTPPAVSAKSYGWDKVPNRTSVQMGAGTPVTYSFEAANRLTSDSAGNGYTFDADGRLTVRPGQRLVWDSLGRLTQVKPPSGNSAIATYTYDALDRLLLADYGGSNRVRFRYVGQTTAIAQEVNDQSGAVIRSLGNDWTGIRLEDWTASGSSQRFYGTNAHHDVTWLADSTGAVITTLRYDPYGNLVSSTGSGLPDFRFQGSLYDASVDLSWAVNRWYAPLLGQFISEDSLLGDVSDPPSRHLYAYAQGDPVDGWDPDGQYAAGTCGGYGCTATWSPYGRYLQWKAFWRRFPSYDCGYHCYYLQPKTGTGIGGAFLTFMRWIMNSGRLCCSAWWNRVNRWIVQSSLTAWYGFDRSYSATSSDYWYGYSRYIKGVFVGAIPGGWWQSGYYGGTDRQAWGAHQSALWTGVRAARSLYWSERASERLVIWKVLVNVESYYRLGWSLDALLDPARAFGNYPNYYPASRTDACHMWYIGGIATSYVSAIVPPPIVC